MKRIADHLPDARLRYDDAILDGPSQERLFTTIRDELAWETKSIKMFGRVMISPRLTAWHGDAGAVYQYSGLRLDPRPWTRGLATARDLVEAVLGIRFNSVLANLYRDGTDSMGWHSDDEPELGPAPVIASLSLGATRRFTLKQKTAPGVRFAIDLAPGSLLEMSGSTQEHYKHALPKTKRDVGPRINLTFRSIVSARRE